MGGHIITGTWRSIGNMNQSNPSQSRKLSAKADCLVVWVSDDQNDPLCANGRPRRIGQGPEKQRGVIQDAGTRERLQSSPRGGAFVLNIMGAEGCWFRSREHLMVAEPL